TTPLLWADDPSPFRSFLGFSDWLHDRVRRTDGIALVRLMQFLFQYLTTEKGHGPPHVADILLRDYARGGRSDQPAFLETALPKLDSARRRSRRGGTGLKRQARHGLARTVTDSNMPQA
ncbi:MAG: hypothetical protein ACREIC_02580, partial [Limisphaerales bacterium]